MRSRCTAIIDNDKPCWLRDNCIIVEQVEPHRSCLLMHSMKCDRLFKVCRHMLYGYRPCHNHSCSCHRNSNLPARISPIQISPYPYICIYIYIYVHIKFGNMESSASLRPGAAVHPHALLHRRIATLYHVIFN